MVKDNVEVQEEVKGEEAEETEKAEESTEETPAE